MLGLCINMGARLYVKEHLGAQARYCQRWGWPGCVSSKVLTLVMMASLHPLMLELSQAGAVEAGSPPPTSVFLAEVL